MSTTIERSKTRKIFMQKHVYKASHVLFPTPPSGPQMNEMLINPRLIAMYFLQFFTISRTVQSCNDQSQYQQEDGNIYVLFWSSKF